MVVAWATFVWGLGSDGFSNEDTSRYLGPLVDWLFGSLSAAARESILFWIRKAAHPVEYGIWAALLVRAFWLSQLRDALRLAGCTLALVFALAAADEIRQGRSDARDGSGWDALLDLAGGGAAVVCVLWAPRPLRSWWLPDPAERTTGGQIA